MRYTLLLLLLLAAVAVAAASSSSLSQLERDLLCACRKFHTNRTGMSRLRTTNGSAFEEDAFCSSVVGFDERWETFIPGRVELGVGPGGLRALVYVSKIKGNDHAIIAFRHFEHERNNMLYVDDDYWQEISMFGGEMLVRTAGWPALLASWAQSLVFYARLLLGFDYHMHACTMVEELTKHGRKKVPIFTGYGHGGTLAALQAARVESSLGIVFSAHRTKALQRTHGVVRTTNRVTNLILQSEVASLYGERGTKECVFPDPPEYAHDRAEGKSSVYSAEGFASFRQDLHKRECVTV